MSGVIFLLLFFFVSLRSFWEINSYFEFDVFLVLLICLTKFPAHVFSLACCHAVETPAEIYVFYQKYSQIMGASFLIVSSAKTPFYVSSTVTIYSVEDVNATHLWSVMWKCSVFLQVLDIYLCLVDLCHRNSSYPRGMAFYKSLFWIEIFEEFCLNSALLNIFLAFSATMFSFREIIPTHKLVVLFNIFSNIFSNLRGMYDVHTYHGTYMETNETTFDLFRYPINNFRYNGSTFDIFCSYRNISLIF